MRSFNIIKYNENFYSVKDIDKSIEISDSKWDEIFHLIQNFSFVYFHGERCFRYTEDLDCVIAQLSKTIDALTDNFYILLQIDNSILTARRKDFGILWDSYEFSALIFSQDPLEEEVLKLEFRNKLSFDRLLKEFPKVLIVYRSFESDVLWVKKTDLLPSMTLLLPFLSSYGATNSNQ